MATKSADASLEERTRLFLANQPMLRAYVHALVRHRQDAEDLLQEVGVRILTHEGAPLDPATFRPWSRGVARNLMLHHWRSKRRSLEDPADPLLDLIDGAHAEADADHRDWEARRQALGTCLQTLAPKARELLSLRYVDEQSSDQIGVKLGRSAASVRMTLMRIRDSLVRCVQKRLHAHAKGSS